MQDALLIGFLIYCGIIEKKTHWNDVHSSLENVPSIEETAYQNDRNGKINVRMCDAIQF